jgi:asparagine synthase (glutamine-hydrolysing)
MCSISGIISISDVGVRKSAVKQTHLEQVVGQMNAALRHRGPDDRGIVTCKLRSASCPGEVVLGNTRLAIIDMSAAGHQPMHDPDTGNWITYNGETYNYRQLRKEIGDDFGPWRSSTDTEVVLRAYRKWGIEAFGRLRGMFALAIWDNRKEELVLARDQFGIKPLYYFLDSTEASANLQPSCAELFIFASEIRALLASELVPRKLSVAAVRSFLEYGSVQSPLSIVEKVRSLMPGQCLRVRKNSPSSLNLELSQFTIPSCLEQQPDSRIEAIAKLKTLLEDSVQQHLISDVPLGVFLSGGMDSSAIVALMSRVSTEQPKTFSVVFDEHQFNEATHSRLVAEKFKTDHCEVRLNQQSLLTALPEAIVALDQPTMDGINTYVVSKAVKNGGLTVALSGLGGDELFGGYPSFRRALKFQSTNSLTKSALKAIARIGDLSANSSTQRSKFRQLAASNYAPADVYRITRQLFSPDTVKLLSQTVAENQLETKSDSNGHSDTVNAISKLEMEGYMANTLLRDTDVMSMAHSLEVRVPFVDSRVAEFVLNLPGEWKLNGNAQNRPKALLAEVLTDFLPQEFLVRKKMGFTLPFEHWMRSKLRNEISEVFAHQGLLASSGINQSAAEQVWHRFLRNPKAVGWSRPWSLYVLARWCELNRVTN